MKYICKICKYIYDEKKEGPFALLDNTYLCPKCSNNKNNFQPLSNNATHVFEYSINVSENNPSIIKDNSLCIDCGNCYQTCKEKCNLDCKNNPEECLYCGQCLLTCPTKALKSNNHIDKIKQSLDKGSLGICYISPASRVSIGTAFGYQEGQFLPGKLVALLKEFGFTYVFDTTFGADLTVMEESEELITRLKNKGPFPMFSSCCPAWVKYAHLKYPALLENLSTCKSPIGMQSAMIENYLIPTLNTKRENIITVAITPCTAKKAEIKSQTTGCDEVITIQELIDWTKKNHIDFQNLPNQNFDEFYNEGSGAGLSFGYTKGVATAIIKTVYFLLTNQKIPDNLITFKEIPWATYAKELEITINQTPLKIAVIHQISSLNDFLLEMEKRNQFYHFIEVMNCKGGCIGGGGLPRLEHQSDLNNRLNSLKQHDDISLIKASYNNPSIKTVYQKYLGYPGSLKAHQLLHVSKEHVNNL